MAEQARLLAAYSMAGPRLSFHSLGSMKIRSEVLHRMLTSYSQPFWGEMVAIAGAGPQPIRIKALNSRNLREAISFCLSEEAAKAAGNLAQKLHADLGVKAAMASFHRHLRPERLSCNLAPEHPAVWACSVSKRGLKLSATCAEILIDHNRINRKDLKMSVLRFCVRRISNIPHRLATNPIHIETRRIEPVTGGLSALMETGNGMVGSAAGIFLDPYKEYRRISQTKSTDRKSLPNPAVTMPLASLKNIGRFNSSLFKGTMVDIPMAVTEGFLAVPKMCGEPQPGHAPITNAQSGLMVAGKVGPAVVLQ